MSITNDTGFSPFLSSGYSWQQKRPAGGTGLSGMTFRNRSGSLFSHRLVVAALGRIDLTSFLQFGTGLGNFLGIHAESLGDIAGTDGLAGFLHSGEDLIFHNELLCGFIVFLRKHFAVLLRQVYTKS